MSRPGQSASRVFLRVLAGGLLGFGLVSGYFALKMDTTVLTPGGVMYGIEVPSYRVNNLGLMDERRTKLLVAGFVIVVGLALYVAGGTVPSGARLSPTFDGGFRTCPSCAEDIRREAVVCRYCGRDIPPLDTSAPALSPEKPQDKPREDGQDFLWD